MPKMLLFIAHDILDFCTNEYVAKFLHLLRIYNILCASLRNIKSQVHNTKLKNVFRKRIHYKQVV